MLQREYDDFCAENRVHPETLDAVRFEERLVDEVSDLFRLIGDPTRARILFTLGHSELCVCDIAELLGMSSSAISHQLRLLRQTRLVCSRRDGKTVFYRLADTHIRELFDTALTHIREG